MRQIGSISDPTHAQVFVDYLVIQGIPAQAESDEGGWSIWVRDENDVETARSDLAEFKVNPDNSRYADVGREAKKLRDAEISRRRKAAKRTVDMRNQWSRPMSRRAPMVMTLIGLSILLGLLSGLGGLRDGQIMRTLGFADIVTYLETGDGLQQIRQGQIWRLVTPIFLHGGALHLIFNMYWLYILGTQVEVLKGTVRFGLIVLAIAVISNLAQFFIGKSPNFFGMSGVVYGILGYIWIKQQYEPAAGFQLQSFTFFFLIIVMVIGFLGLIGGIANWAHLGGLLTGMAIAYIPVLFPRIRI